MKDWNGCPHLTLLMKKLQSGGMQLLLQVSQSISHSEKTLTLACLLQSLFTVLSTSFSSAFQSSWQSIFFTALSLTFFCRFLAQPRREVVEETVSPWRSLDTYSYNKYHPMEEVSKDTWSLVVATAYFRMGEGWFTVNIHRLENLKIWGRDLPVYWVIFWSPPLRI